MAESLALLRVGKRRLESALCNSRCLRSNADAAAVKRGKRNFVTFTFVPDTIGDRAFAIGERKLRASRGVNAQLLLFLAHRKAARSLLHHQRSNSLFAFLGLRVDVHERGIGGPTIGDPRLGPLDDVSIAFARRFRRERRRVGSGLRFGERVASDFFPARIGNEEFLLLFIGAKTVDRIAVERVLNGKNGAGGSANARK